MHHRRSILLHALAIGFLAFGGIGMNCQPPAPVPRPPGTDGSAKWAFAIAQPVISGVAADAELRQVLGATVLLDGRLPSNTGDWSFVAWSPSQAKTVQVTVLANGTTNTSERADAAPGPGIVKPLPAGWADSTIVFQATNGHRDTGATVAQLVVLNVASYDKAPNQAVWGINFNAGENQLVKFDGTYIGPQ